MRNIIIALLVVLGVVALRFGFVRTERPAAPGGSDSSAIQPDIPEEFLSPHLRILMFYSAEAAPRLGRPATVCYGVVNAVKVRLDPPLAAVSPSASRCFSVTVDRPQMLTLTATGGGGEEAVAAFRLGVKTPRPVITSLQLSTFTPKRGETVTLCYGTRFAAKVRLAPEGPLLAPAGRHCVEWHPDAPAYWLVAEGKDGRDETPLPLKYID
ncbi:MAG: hypothetical protein IH602_04585 [Bryobacteraceae bacterium]|nr:hypothetical protein [Bryobacteraceae bacterium]